MSVPQPKKLPGGLPPWMATFADLMALMMTFFVLLFAYSKVEEEKFKQMAGSMAEAFGGVQYIKSNSEDSVPGMEAGVMSSTGYTPLQFDPKSGRIVSQPLQGAQQGQDRHDREAQELLEELQDALSEDVEAGAVVLEKNNHDIVIRFPEHVSFASGSANLVARAMPLISRIVSLIHGDKMLIVAGHTDNRPVGSGTFRSNWGLSAARAASVADQILRKGNIDPSRLVVAGYADTRPIAPNDTADRRARNRRVEIIVRKATDEDSDNSNQSEDYLN